MEVLEIILTVLEVISSVALVLVVLLQSGKQSGLSGALAGNADSFMSKGKSSSLDKLLASSTKWIALVWIVLTLVLSMF
jgi:preprotein translocase subunit SecG